MSSVRRALVAVLAAVSLGLVGGCGSDASPRPAPSTPAPSTPASSSASSSASRVSVSSTPPSSAASAAPYVAPKKCLLRTSQVEAVLGGNWSRKDGGSGNCVYTSDRQAIFAIQSVPTPPAELQAALADARVNSCDTPPRDVAGTGGGFVCIERSPDGDTVEGNIVARGHFWLFVIIGAGSDRDYPAQRKAMTALLGEVSG